ncbi:MAG: ribosome silencing factor [Bryobacteraceae bacterium]|nr:ribosome silencing factor [Bryobacterales bacterium]MEB2360947.1 ribosome silencing factor [Bryobacterales bacterium]NUN03190.1 ribosome silencing factor [Bryobacteraceae bacterium]
MARTPRSEPFHDPSEAAASEPNWAVAVRAAEAKKAKDIRVLDLRGITTFADYFVICSGANPRQIRAIADEIGAALKKYGERPANVEGYDNAGWVLLDYGDLLVHVFSDEARSYYDLERLWRQAKEVPVTPG